MRKIGLADAEIRLERLTRLRAKAFEIGDVARQAMLTDVVRLPRLIDEHEAAGNLLPESAARLRARWLAGDLTEYDFELDGPHASEWLEQQREAWADGARFRDASLHISNVSVVESLARPFAVARRSLPGSRRTSRQPGQRRAATSRDGPDEPEPPLGRPSDLTALQRALLPFACSMELAAELDERELEAFVSIASIRLAREASRLCWWEQAA